MQILSLIAAFTLAATPSGDWEDEPDAECDAELEDPRLGADTDGTEPCTAAGCGCRSTDRGATGLWVLAFGRRRVR